MSDRPGPQTRISENPLHLSFWFGEVDPRPAAIFRIVLGLTLLHYLGGLSVDVSAFFSDSGMLPRSTAGVHFQPGVFNLFGDPRVVGAVYAAGVIAVLAFTLGYRTRLATVATWVFMTSLHRRNPFIVDGGDELVRNLLFLSMFTDLGRAFSLDVFLRRKSVGPVSPLGWRFLGLHVAILYLLTGYMKARNGWLTSNPIYAGFQLTGFLRPPGAWLMNWPEVCRALGLATLATEVSFAFLAFSPVRIPLSRALAVAAGIGLQVGILITMRVGIFTETMIAGALVFVQPQWLDWMASKWKSLRVLGTPTLGGSETPTSVLGIPTSALRATGFAFLSMNALAFLGWGPLLGRVRMPDWLTAERRGLSLVQSSNLFTDNDPVPVWESPGVTLAGEPTSVLQVTRPGVVPTGPGWMMSRWYKLNYHTNSSEFPFDGLGRYLCHEYVERTGVHLQSFEIILTHTPARQPGDAPQPATRKKSLAMVCPADQTR